MTKWRGMSKPEFTPGPWAVEVMPSGRVTVTSGQFFICGDENTYGVIDANANLIAAAPDLYEASTPFDDLATQQAVDSPEWRDADTVTVIVSIGALRAIKAALAKARGKTHPSGDDRHGE